MEKSGAGEVQEHGGDVARSPGAVLETRTAKLLAYCWTNQPHVALIRNHCNYC